MKFTAQQIAEAINGKIDGSPKAEVSSLSKIEEGKPGSLSFLANPKYTQYIYTTKASIVIVNDDFKAEKDISATLIRVKDAYGAFAGLLEMYQAAKGKRSGISEKAHIEESATIGKNVYIGPFVFIGKNTVIGDNSFIYPNTSIGDHCKVGSETLIYDGVKIYDECLIGSHCTIHAGAVIGADGFGFAPSSANEYKKVPQIGNVVVEDHVEIGANTTIDRATIGSTIIRKGVKLDNLIQIAHNVEVGENTVIAAQTGVSGSNKIGRNCMIGGQVGMDGHLSIADEVKIAAQSGIGKSITKVGDIVMGSPSFNIRDYQRSYVIFRNLNKIVDRINNLERKNKEEENS